MIKQPKGYTYDKRQKNRPYKVRISSHNKVVFYSSFATEKEARDTYLKVRAEHPMLPPSGNRKSKYE